MSSSKLFLGTILLVLLAPVFTKGDFLSPLVDNICNEVECGKGTCQPAVGSPFNFKCICEPNWKRTRLDNEDDLQFLPCVIPNCSLDYSCMPAPPPVPPFPNNFSVFDPCYWMYCGEGTCVKNSTYGHTCQCNNGRSNLLDISVFPCYSECALGSDCSRLGIKVSNSVSSPNNNDGSPGTSIMPAKFQWMGIIMLIFGVVQVLN
ncbi:OLC1v1000912C1 [Oldenlandia corymbosa var. corymbosa]|uniref:OLC1v1000912C1 n=1 Tax=Oldenlandia corymbosa var. corymbosa TaxID=529605 RepID=A0AAV1D6C7_OLDCO|nr:OLC1v1000912C1 [Oldenlandia corymbosa var. corymbosa]